MNRYYAKKLSAERLEQCYLLAPLRVQDYLNAEIDFVLGRLRENDLVLELGCGYGRIFPKLLSKVKTVFGIDNSIASLLYAKKILSDLKPFHLSAMNAANVGFKDKQFDVVICIQNGLSAFKVNQKKLLEESIRTTKLGGLVLFSSYAEKFWEHRLKWFQIQSEHNLLGEIDYEKTGNGVIVCKDGFKATTIMEKDFISLTSETGLVPEIIEIDNSSIFCVMEVT